MSNRTIFGILHNPAPFRKLKPDILARISKIKRELGDIASKTEKDFMDLGQLLMEGSEVDKIFQGKAFEILSVARGDKGKKDLATMKDHINSALVDLRNDKETIKRQFASVKNVLVNLGELQSKNGDIERLARYLRAVALNIFIETSRSQALSSNFSIIADEIKRLSETIVDLSKSVNATVDEGKKRFLAHYAATQRGITEFDQITAGADKTVHEAVYMTDGWLNLVEKTASQLLETGKILPREVEKIVIALQFHDAMRQRLEHIITGLADMAELCGETEESDGDAGLQTLSKLHAIAALLTNHVQQMVQEIGDVFSTCDQSFNTLDKAVKWVGGEVARLVGGEEDGGASACLLASLQSFRNVQTRAGELTGKVDEICGVSLKTTASLTELTGQIHGISMDAHIKGINAIIAATHLGNEGRTLSVLAGEMKRLSDLVDRFVKDAEAIIRKTISDLDASREERRDDTQEKKIEAILNGILHGVDHMKKKADELFNHMGIMGDIHLKVKEKLRIIPAMGDDLGHQKKNMDEMVMLLAPYSDKKDSLDHSSMFSRYTMEKERMIHKATVSQSGGIVADNQAAGTESELGDNVELF